MTLKVIGAGLGRTGTHSLALALEMLGFGPCYTIHDLKKNPDHVAIWTQAIGGTNVDWQRLYQSYHSAVEWPTVSFLPQLLPNYPAAKVILTVRDAEKWYESASPTIFRSLELSPYNPNPPGPHRPAIEMTRRLILEVMFSGRYRDKAYAIEVYRRHVRTVIEMVPASRLLQYEITEGWEPLCEFLGVAIPDEGFPHLNDRTSMLSSAPNWFKELTSHSKERRERRN